MAHWPSGSFLMASSLSADSTPAAFAAASAAAASVPEVADELAAVEADAAGAGGFAAVPLAAEAPASGPLLQPATRKHAKATATSPRRTTIVHVCSPFETAPDSTSADGGAQ